MKNILNILTAFVLVTGFSSCLKDDTIIGPNSPGAIKNVIEFANVGSIKSPTTAPFAVFIPSTLDPSLAESQFEGVINYAGSETAPQDIVVNLAIDPSMLTTYNGKVADAAYVPLAAGTFSFPATVTIPSGQRQAKFAIKFNPNKFNPLAENALALRITSASAGTISGNFGAVIYSLPLRSVWEGTYSVSINNNYAGTQPAIGKKDRTGVTLETVGPNKVEVSGLAQTYAGNVQYQFNADNTTITSVRAYNGATVYSSTIQGVDVIDPVKGIFEIRWTFNGWGLTERWVKEK